MTQPHSSDDSTFKVIKKHDQYYIPGADLVFLVGGIHIRVHRFFFDRESRVFREQVLPVPVGGTPPGYTDSTAIKINVPLEDFVKLLGVFYNPTYTLFNLTIADWTTILDLAHTWEFQEVKRLAIRELQKHDLGLVPRIALYQTYDAGPGVLVPLYARLCMRGESLSDEEAADLGIKTTVRVYRARELLRAVPAGANNAAGDKTAKAGTGSGDSTTAAAPSAKEKEKEKEREKEKEKERERLLKLVGDVFGMDTPASSPTDDTGPGNKKGKKGV